METSGRISLGKQGEDLAVASLEERGYHILERNYRIKLGEIDIVARQDDTICFVEVKTRTTPASGHPGEAISRSKQHKLSKVALSYLKDHKLMNKRARFDVVSIITNAPQEKSIKIVQNAFELSRAYGY